MSISHAHTTCPQKKRFKSSGLRFISPAAAKDREVPRAAAAGNRALKRKGDFPPLSKAFHFQLLLFSYSSHRSRSTEEEASNSSSRALSGLLFSGWFVVTPTRFLSLCLTEMPKRDKEQA